MTKQYKQVLDQLDNLMIALSKQKQIGLDSGVVVALKDLTRARNAFKREYIKMNMPPREERKDTVFTNFLDTVANNLGVS